MIHNKLLKTEAQLAKPKTNTASNNSCSPKTITTRYNEHDAFENIKKTIFNNHNPYKIDRAIKQ